AAGLFAIKSQGGVAIVQEPQDALFPDMPLNARTVTPVDYSAPKDEIAKLIINLVDTTGPTKPGAAMANGDDLKQETDVVALENSAIDDEDRPGTPSVYGCPDCGGTLWELQDDEWLRFRCRVGHAYSAEGLLNSQTTAMESALWNAFRALHENAALARRVAKRARDNNQIAVAEKLEQRSRQGEEEAELIRSLLLIGQPKSDASPRMD
ncbi:MAG TPA: chemotaxis protein CheB, partial [Candidatus Saccharimonadales bacterium]|nr:chemotaxis protein CheB [Candidatus Saccharimonadales bacterium]